MLAAMHPNDTDSNEFSSHQPDIAFDEESRPEPSVGFSFEEIERELGESLDDPERHSTFTQQEWDAFAKGLEKVFRWIYQDPHHRNLDGIQIRALIVAWIVVKELQPLTLTQLARMYGKDKQSFGRWVDEFKKEFREVRNCHMKE
jgi:hypothetical protein